MSLKITVVPANARHGGHIVLTTSPTSLTVTYPQKVARSDWVKILSFNSDYTYNFGVESTAATISFDASIRELTIKVGGHNAHTTTRVSVPYANFAIADLDNIRWHM
jgi:hypothetical protein